MISKRNFGRTGHKSSAAIFGGFALFNVAQSEANELLDLLTKYGVNHIDTAPAYGDSEIRIGPWMKDHRDEFFLATKVHERTYGGAWREIKTSLKRLGVDRFDLLQMHSLTNEDQWETAFGANGALKALIKARDQGLVNYLGVTGHSLKAPKMHMRSLKEFDFDSVLLPYNYPLMQNPEYAADFNALIQMCEKRKVAVQTIKSIGQRLWEDGEEKTRNTWYKPLEEQIYIDPVVHWVLAAPGLFLVTAGDKDLLPKILDAADRFDGAEPPTDKEMEEMVQEANMEPLWPGGIGGGQ